MPNFLQSASNLFFAPANWINRATTPTPTGLFQSRVTHTPGGFYPQKTGVLGSYTDELDPRQLAMSTGDISPAERATLAQQWGKLGNGVITLPPGPIDPVTMQHEQIHALQHNAGLDQYSGPIAGLVDPGLTDLIKQSPIYQKEFQQFGQIPTIASEGSAIQLTKMPYAQTTPALQDEIMRHLKDSVQQKQFKQLTKRSDQSQK